MNRIQIVNLDPQEFTALHDLTEAEIFAIQGGLFKEIFEYIDQSWKDIKKGLSDGYAKA